MCRRIAKPGIEVKFTYDFLDADDLIDWCAANDLNCFMYTRNQPGLSATTDQAILSGRPLLTLSNDTFRHIHPYIPPYPCLSLRNAMDNTTAAVRRMQRDWSREGFLETFHKMLAAFGLTDAKEGARSFRVRTRSKTTHSSVASCTYQRHHRDNVLDYSTRVAESMGRTGEMRTARLRCAVMCRIWSDSRPYASAGGDAVGPTSRRSSSETQLIRLGV